MLCKAGRVLQWVVRHQLEENQDDAIKVHPYQISEASKVLGQ